MSRRHDREGGQALVEFALMIPIIMLLMIGLFDLGRVVFINNSLSDGARHGARHAATDPKAATFCADVDAAVRSAIRGQPLTTYTVELTTVDGDGAELDTYLVCRDGADGIQRAAMIADNQVDPGDRVTVDLEAQVDLSVGFVISAVGIDTFTLGATSTMQITFAP